MISLMLGTVGLAYGSVPLYKMVRIIHEMLSGSQRTRYKLTLLYDVTDLPANRLGRSTCHNSPWGGQRYLGSRGPCNGLPATSNYIQRFSLRRVTMEVYTTTA